MLITLDLHDELLPATTGSKVCPLQGILLPDTGRYLYSAASLTSR